MPRRLFLAVLAVSLVMPRYGAIHSKADELDRSLIYPSIYYLSDVSESDNTQKDFNTKEIERLTQRLEYLKYKVEGKDQKEVLKEALDWKGKQAILNKIMKG